MSPEMRRLGWLPIIGGPYEGCDYYPPNEPIAGRHVQLGFIRNGLLYHGWWPRHEYDAFGATWLPYYINDRRDAVVYRETAHVED